jgi:radical SAM protein with 4Fe4S-binding SPASM domain
MPRIDTDKQTKVREWLLEPNNNFCALPFIHMAIEANGDIRPCCIGKPLGINIKDKTIADAYNHPIRQEFIDSFKRNEQHPKCIACWKDPIPTRVRYSTYYQSLDFSYDVMNGTQPEDKLTWLEIKPGNKCNLKCRICGVHNSSTWTKDTYELSLGDDPVFLDPNNAFIGL